MLECIKFDTQASNTVSGVQFMELQALELVAKSANPLHDLIKARINIKGVILGAIYYAIT